MSNNKMLIDATHPEETRVVVLRNNRVEEFDYESAARTLLRGNIYLAKVTRVEPSLQAAFVDYGGNRHGFLAFNEIHPDYYQIPMADRQALLEEEAAAEAREEAEADARAERLARRRRPRPGGKDAEGDEAAEFEPTAYTVDTVEENDEGDLDEDADDPEDDEEPARTVSEASRADDDTLSEDRAEREPSHEAQPYDDDRAARDAETGDGGDASTDDDGLEASAEAGADGQSVEIVAPPSSEPEPIDQVGSEDALEELPRPRRRARSYKIQEVIKRRQIILVQVVKEERGNKGAALTTYLSLAGRYTVLMPNTARGGGISRKITNPQDRKRLKAIAAELDVPEGMGLIIRTAGAARTKQEIKRDFEYLLRLWESVRDLTLQSTAPSLVYEEGNLIKRSIRDLYDKDVEEVIVAGDRAYEEARDFMRMLMPSHAKNVHQHSDPEPLFTRYGIERQLNAMFSPYVTLRSGGYLVINQTEALVAIDVNSGKATREFSIEETAHNTNMEAADEIARQLKLRDLAGLIVIDFIDMEEKRNNRQVERRLKDALRFDRARIQLGRISHFGLMEMSRQRLRTGVLEGSTSQCPHCQGTGIIRSTESVALAVLRGLEDTLMQGARTSLVATTTAQVALYILNNKRQFINDMEARNGVTITVQASDKMQGANFTIERGSAASQPIRRPERAAVNMNWGFDGDGEAEALGPDDDEMPSAAPGREPDVRSASADGEREEREERGRRRRRRRGRRGANGDRFEGEQPRAFAEPRERGPRRGFDGDPDQNGDADRLPRPAGAAHADIDVDAEMAGGEEASPATGRSRDEEGDGDGAARRRRRGRRGGRRGRGRERGDRPQASLGAGHVTEEIIDDFDGAVMPDELEGADRMEDMPAPPRTRQPTPRQHVIEERGAVAEVEDAPPAAREEERKTAPRRSLASSSEPRIERVVVGADEDSAPRAEPPETPKRGWWQRRLGG